MRWWLAAGVLAMSAAASAEPPNIVADGSLQPAEEAEQAARAAWRDLEHRVQASAQWSVAATRGTVTLRRELHLAPGQAGASVAGSVAVRQDQAGRLDDAALTTLRHEMAHQFLWLTCQASADDRLFHEAFAVAVSGELAAWNQGGYLNLPRAVKVLQATASLDDRSARRALARVLWESPPDAGAIPAVLEGRLRRCASGATWEPLTVDELAGGVTPTVGDALVVLNRHSGEILTSKGDWRTPMPMGSTLKPFLVAGVLARGGSGPLLKPQSGDSEWACGAHLPSEMDLDTALLRSCNGYFLEWAKQDPAIAQFGVFGSVLTAVGLNRAPQDISEAIGIRPTLAISPMALAQGYRLLAESRPDVIATLSHNAERGTLAGLSALKGIAAKTGTVRDASSRPTLGWVVAVSDDLVVVMARRGKMPRDFAEQIAAQVHPTRAQNATEVQVLGLVAPEQIELECPRLGYVLEAKGPVAMGTEFGRLLTSAQRGPLVCLGAPWIVRFPDAPKGREYAGVFRLDAAPAYEGRTDEVATERAKRARRGSDFIFRTSLLRYSTGVVAAEDARLKGSAREALLRVVAHNAQQPRHGTRPLCDTTHCQAFLGTVAPQPGDAHAVGRDVPKATGWLLFSQGGDEAWERTKSAAEVEAILGRGATALRFGKGRVLYVRQADGDFDEGLTAPCEDLREPLKLPSCPDSVRADGGVFVFRGHGQGHGQGLDVERARVSEASADTILRQAYGP